MADTSSEFGTVIGPDAVFKGDMTFDSAAKVLGKIEGSISSKGRVHVANGSSCKATIAAKEIAVEGHIEGNVEASDLVELKPNGMITGDVIAKRMSMSDGSSINGYCRIGTNGAATSNGKAQQTVESKDAAPTRASATTAASKK